MKIHFVQSYNELILEIARYLERAEVMRYDAENAKHKKTRKISKSFADSYTRSAEELAEQVAEAFGGTYEKVLAEAREAIA